MIFHEAEVITLTEGILTFLMFFVLLIVSYMADIGMIRIADLCESCGGNGGSNKVRACSGCVRVHLT